MSTAFQPIEIPPGVVATPTKKMMSSNYAEVNMVRWNSGQLAPIGGQAKYNYTFTSPCRAIHGWYDLGSVYHVAYLCETNVYVDTGGQITEITPAGGLTPPTLPGQGGYGDLDYSDDNYGTPRATRNLPGFHDIPPAWSMDNFGQILLVQTSPDGRLLEWNPQAAIGTKLTAVANAPLGRSFVVTSQRFVMMFGILGSGGSARRFGWSDQETYNNWDFANVATKAGFYDIEPASPIMMGISGRPGVMFFTAKKAYLVSYTGLPYIYSYTELADGPIPWSPKSIVATASQTLWMSEQGLWAFDGTSISPISCPVFPWVVDDIDDMYVRYFACAVHVGDFNEFWWFFPQVGKGYNTRAVIYNYKEGWWGQAQMSRSAGITSSYTVETIMADRTSSCIHETGIAYFNSDIPWVETFNLNVTKGSRLVTIKQLLPDIEGNVDQLRYNLFYRNSRSTGTGEVATPLVKVRDNGYVDFRTTGRDIRLRLSVTGPNVFPFVVGQHQIDIVPRGDR
jgi:hypothetical protein